MSCFHFLLKTEFKFDFNWKWKWNIQFFTNIEPKLVLRSIEVGFLKYPFLKLCIFKEKFTEVTASTGLCVTCKTLQGTIHHLSEKRVSELFCTRDRIFYKQLRHFSCLLCKNYPQKFTIQVPLKMELDFSQNNHA